jgi:GWxTD domain-containing protein
VTAGLGADGRSTDWAKSPQAVFLTTEEAKAWSALKTDAERTNFEATYWARRDPNVATPGNEFKLQIEKRIDEADRKLGLGHTAGSSTARGRVYVLLGPPAVQQQVSGPLDATPRYNTPFQLSLSAGALDYREWQIWVYDQLTTQVANATHLTRIELSFAVDPHRGDQLQNPGRFEPIRRAIAASTIQGRP